MNVLSLCDGVSTAMIALKELNIPVENYFASEIDQNSIKISSENFPEIKQIGDVTKIDKTILCSLPKIDLVCFGFVCRSLTRATAGRPEYNNGLKGISGLFYSCNEILKWIKNNNNPDVKFMVENVESNNKDDLKIISDELGVKPVRINASDFSAQDRLRLYWTNIPIDPVHETNDEVLRDVLDYYGDVDDKYFYKCGFVPPYEVHPEKRVSATLDIKGHDIIRRVYNPDYKSPTLVACRGGNHQVKVLLHGSEIGLKDGWYARKLTPHEYRKLQGIPEWFKMNVANTHIYNTMGDGWSVPVIKHIFSGLLL